MKMLAARLIFLCLWCIALAQSAEDHGQQGNKALQKDLHSNSLPMTATAKATAAAAAGAAQSSIYNIKRLKDKRGQHKLRLPMSDVADMPDKPPRTKKPKNITKNAHSLNKQLLNQLGFTKVKAPNSHNRKRLAVESRRHASRDDSHMFIIKLPPNLYYYTSPTGKVVSAKTDAANGKHANQQKAATKPTTTTTSMLDAAALAFASSPFSNDAKKTKTANIETTANANALEALNANGKKVSFPFSSNGRPGRIYHWNLPVLKKALEDKQRFAHVPKTTKDRLLDIENIPTWSKPWENETIEKSFPFAGNKSNYKKSLKPKSPSYYAPMHVVNKNSFHKYFAGNGKPKGFYVIKENHKKPLYYKNIIS